MCLVLNQIYSAVIHKKFAIIHNFDKSAYEFRLKNSQKLSFEKSYSPQTIVWIFWINFRIKCLSQFQNWSIDLWMNFMCNFWLILPIRYASIGENMQTAKTKAIKIVKTLKFILYCLFTLSVLKNGFNTSHKMFLSHLYRLWQLQFGEHSIAIPYIQISVITFTTIWQTYEVNVWFNWYRY